MSRTQNAVKNIFWGVVSQFAMFVFGFMLRTVFIYVLGSTYLGVDGLYTEILSMLSLAELGFGTAMSFSLYKPVADNDHDKIIKLLDFYKTVYRVIAAIVAIAGLCIVPFLGYLVKGADWLTLRELRAYFLVYLFNTVVGYFVTYRYTYLNALQKNYIQTKIDTTAIVVGYILQILAVVFLKNFMAYLLANSMVILVSRVFVSMYLERKYPIFKEKPKTKLSREERKPIYKDVKGLAVHRVAGVAVNSTDNILISTLTSQGVTAVGLMSNYNLIINSVQAFITMLFSSVTSGFGNLVAASTTENFRKVFKEMDYASFWIYGFCSIAFWILVPQFITLWIGADKLVDQAAFILIVVNYYLQGQSRVYFDARIAKGDFNKDKMWTVMEALVNLIVSVICALRYGLVGIYIGTVVSRLFYMVFNTHATYKFLFEESVLEYYKILIRHFLYALAAALLTQFIVSLVAQEITVLTFIKSAVVVAIVPNLVFLLLTVRSREFAAWKNRVAVIITNIRGY